jgi:hypothetical protein
MILAQTSPQKKKKNSSSIKSGVFRGCRVMLSINVGISSELVKFVEE